ncbi:benzylsuccinate CoA-transferase BbsE subunit [Stella humosa]|uniref:Benzylsuccinate CoA-transferase BbsE subunit n=1 Tax=Stella humosa TaxID=94 RepID=A0A3N1MAR7_9PROT|nr:CoA transferase [Stella humosa]ROP99796.1 benzylsuccinate CoA-transferase BbsE subunit [Stella humosa]BBK30976.1 putative L-carnitine dehydratase [Stella humosa]
MEAFRPYSGIRILDLTHNLGRYATRLFGDLGAEVIRVEPPEGLPDRRLAEQPGRNSPDYAFSFFNASKRSIVLDLAAEKGRATFAAMAKDAHVVFLERGAPLADEIGWVREQNPGAVVTLVSPYGMGGPMEHAPTSDLVLQAAGGIAWMTGRDGEPPLRLPVDQSVMITSVYAAAATAMCLFDAETGGTGHVVDVSAQECIAHSLQNAIQVYDLERRISHRAGEGTRDASEDIYTCKDGQVFLASPPTLGISWKQLLAWMGETSHPSLAEFGKERWLDRRWRQTAEAKGLFRPLFEAFIADYTRDELLAQALKRKVVMAPVARIADVLGDRQLAYRNYFIQMADPRFERPVQFPGAPYKLSEPVWAATPAPALGARG